jgi:hypothetical protein
MSSAVETSGQCIVLFNRNQISPLRPFRASIKMTRVQIRNTAKTIHITIGISDVLIYCLIAAFTHNSFTWLG